MNVSNFVSITALRTLPIFEALDDERLEAIARVAKLCRVDRRTTLVKAGDQVDSIYLVLAGRAKAQVCNGKGREMILYMLGQGDLFGEMEAIDDQPGSVSVVTVDPCDLVVIEKEAFRRCMAENFDVSRYLMRNLARRLRLADSKIGSLAGQDVHDRVACLLYELSETQQGHRVVTRRISRSDIARMVGASREMVSRVMRDLQLRGEISEADGLIWLRQDRFAAA